MRNDQNIDDMYKLYLWYNSALHIKLFDAPIVFKIFKYNKCDLLFGCDLYSERNLFHRIEITLCDSENSQSCPKEYKWLMLCRIRWSLNSWSPIYYGPAKLNLKLTWYNKGILLKGIWKSGKLNFSRSVLARMCGRICASFPVLNRIFVELSNLSSISWFFHHKVNSKVSY